jgi:L-lysine exporter family protein LysE/ArgO
MPTNLPAAALADPGLEAAFAAVAGLEAAFAAVEGLGLGAGLIIAIGAQNAYVLRQGLRRQHVFAVASLCFLIDCSLIALGAGGFAGLLRSVPSLPSLAAWGGAAFLALYSLRAFAAAWRPQALTASEGANGGSLKAALATTLALSLLNPHVYLDTVVLLGGLAARYPGTERLAFALGAMLASGLWFYGLGYGARRLAPFFASPQAWRLLDAFVGAVMAVLAAGLVVGQLS